MDPFAKTFDEWLQGYMVFQAKAWKVTKEPIPIELTALHKEKAILEPLRAEAEGFRAKAVGYYYKSKHEAMNALTDTAATARHDTAKAKCYLQLWAREDSEGIRDSLISRGFEIGRALNQREP